MKLDGSHKIVGKFGEKQQSSNNYSIAVFLIKQLLFNQMNPFYVTEAANKDLKKYVKNEVKKDKSCHTVMSFGISWMLLMNV